MGRLLWSSVVVACGGLGLYARACSNILVTRGASADGKVHVSYNADEASLMGAVSHWPGGRHAAGAVREVYSWDLGVRLGAIPEPAETLNVMGNANEAGVVIGETTHGGLEVLSNSGKTALNGTILDYGSLIWLTLQRATSARMAVEVMVDLCETYGYASSLEGFSIADKDEVWYMELTGRGDFDPRGVLYVALRVPEGAVLAHANQARVTTYLPCDQGSTCRASPDMVDFTRRIGIYDPAAMPEFSFSDVVDPVTFEGARFCEARVWYTYSQISETFDTAFYADYARGYNLTNRMPLWITPTKKLDRHAIHALMSSHYEGSALETTADVGAGPEHSPYRWNGLEWSPDKDHKTTYVNERPVGTQQTGWHFVSTIDGAKPPPMRAVLWFGADDHSWSPKIPLHGGATAVHRSYDDADCTGREACRRANGLPGLVMDLDLGNAWWLNNLVADQVYTRYDRAAPVVRAAQRTLDARLTASLAKAESEALALFAQRRDGEALQVLTAHAIKAGQLATETWLGLWQTLMVTFIDGKIAKPDAGEKTCACTKTAATLTDDFLDKVVADTDTKYLAAASSSPSSSSKATDNGRIMTTRSPFLLRGQFQEKAAFKPIPKMQVRGVAA